VNDPIEPSSPDDLRRRGWRVAVHNDYRQHGQHWTFWLFTRGSTCVKGEGRTDAEALDSVRRQLRSGLDPWFDNPRAVHVLYGGFPLCGFSQEPPVDWPEGMTWVGLSEWEKTTCEGCRAKGPEHLRELPANR